MRYILVFCSIIVLFTSCNSNKQEKNTIQYYPFSFQNIIDKQAENINKTSSSPIKIIYMNNTIEKKKIENSDVIRDIKSFSEFDINKAAWQDSYSIYKSDSSTIFTCKEEKLPLKKITVWGELNNPKLIRVYFINNNNLYQSVKILNWAPNKFYSIYSVQDVQGMDPDTLFIKTYLEGNN